MGRLYVYRRPWSRLARRLKLWKRFIVPGIPGVLGAGAGDGNAFMGPAVGTFAHAGPAVDVNAVFRAAVDATPHAGPATDAKVALRGAGKAKAVLGVE